MMRTLFCALLLMTIGNLSGQKIIKKSIVNAKTNRIQIDTDNCFRLELQTGISDEVVVEALIDGEYKNDLLLSIWEEGKTLHVGAGFHPNFENPNDKLSAHKVVSIMLKVILPQFKEVQVFGTSCNVTANGKYEKLDVTLADGDCRLGEVSRFADVKTQSGNISVKITKASIDAVSKYGTVEKDNIPNGPVELHLTTTTGNIVIKKTE